MTVEAVLWARDPHSHRLQSGQLTHGHEAPRRCKGFQVRCKRPSAGGLLAPGISGLQQPVNSTQLALSWKRQRSAIAEHQWGHAAASAGDWRGLGIHIYQ